ncbi:lipase [Mycena albidolilacea]|uniref:Lipase n=1 Tax=Mycena albidolilacea TaxID=1033008 RepID=A0AAD7EX15_9AGAR|nr:lipase [Mycena albidolilacea]
MQLGRLGIFVLASFLALPGYSAPAPDSDQTIITLSDAQIAAYRPYTFFAGTGYCPANFTQTWSCGANCLANLDFKPVASGGDGEFVQYWFVGYSPSLKRVIVSHEGTRLNAIVSMLTDVSVLQTNLSPVLFPGIGSDVLAHCGFVEEHAKTAPAILATVKTALDKYKASHVTLVGHSLGGALALLDSVYLPLHVPSSVKFNTVAYGLPRVGNRAFANYVDAHTSLARINNQKDIVPVVPSRMPLPWLDYQHAGGEVHIQASGEWLSCPGQENQSELCSVGDVPDILFGSIADHDGPYDGVEISCTYLTGGI